MGVVVASQLLSACVVLPVPSHRGAVVVKPGMVAARPWHGGHGHGHGHHGRRVIRLRTGVSGSEGQAWRDQRRMVMGELCAGHVQAYSRRR